MKIIVATVDFRGYVACYARAVADLGHDVVPYVGLRQYHLPTRARRVVQVRIPALLKQQRDRNWSERSRFRQWLRRQDLNGALVLMVNGQQLIDDDTIAAVHQQGGRIGLWLLDGVSALPTFQLRLTELDHLASFSVSECAAVSSETGKLCEYVPQGFDRHLRLQSRPYEQPVVLVGNPGPRRVEVVNDLLRRHIALELVGKDWPVALAETPNVRFVAHDVTLEEASGYYSQARTCLNIHQRPGSGTGVNPRTFEVPAAGGLLVSDNPTVDQFYESGAEALRWNTTEEAAELVARAERDRTWAERIAERGHDRAHAEHTLDRRFASLLKAWGYPAVAS